MKRHKVLSGIMSCLLVFTVGALVFVQIIMNARYKAMSEDNRLKIVPLAAPRGAIYDRNGRDLAKDEISFDVAVKHVKKKDSLSLAHDLSVILEMEEAVIEHKLREAARKPYVPFIIEKDVGIEKAIMISEVGSDHPGLILDINSRRRYPMLGHGSNYLGYVGKINREEFQLLKPYGFRMDDLVGRSGLEKYYDDYLRGRHGGKQLEVDNRGRAVKVLGLKNLIGKILAAYY